jgi:hypothetical protein
MRLNKLANVIMRNLMVNLKNNFTNDVTTETAKLCTILSRADPPNTEVMLNGLFIDSLSLRRTAMNLLYLYTISTPKELEHLTKSLIAVIPTDPNSNCVQYFDLLCKCISNCLNSKPPVELGWG